MNLTELWKANGAIRTQAPNFWLTADDTKEFVDTVCKKLNATQDCIIETKRGKGGGTWAHKQIGLAYAKYLSPELHMLVNQVFFERLEEEADPELGINRAYDRAVTRYKKQGKSDQWISMRFKTILDTKKFHSTIGRRGAYGKMYAKCHNAIYIPILGGTAKEVREQKQLAKTANVRDNLNM